MPFPQKNHNKGLFRHFLALCALLSCSAQVGAFSTGAPICEVNSLPLVQMAPALASPPPSGWALVAESETYLPGTPVIVRVENEDPLRQALGVLIWAKLNATSGAGWFELPMGGRFQYIPAAANCGQWAITHVDSGPKDQADLIFIWHPPSEGSVILRAFVIEDCEGDCRSYQALTNIEFVSSELVFSDPFEMVGN